MTNTPTMTLTSADRVPAPGIVPGDMIRSTHVHDVPGMACKIGCREMDVEVTATTDAGMKRVIECRACSRFLGARAGMVIVLVLERTDSVMRIGHLGAAA